MDRVIGRKAIADKLQRSVRTVTRMIDRGELRAHRVGGLVETDAREIDRVVRGADTGW